MMSSTPDTSRPPVGEWHRRGLISSTRPVGGCCLYIKLSFVGIFVTLRMPEPRRGWWMEPPCRLVVLVGSSPRLWDAGASPGLGTRPVGGLLAGAALWLAGLMLEPRRGCG